MTTAGVKHVTVFYSFEGQEGVLEQYALSSTLPDRINQLEAERAELEGRLQSTQLENLQDDLGSFQRVAPIRSRVPKQVAECWGVPVTVAEDGASQTTSIVRFQDN